MYVYLLYATEPDDTYYVVNVFDNKELAQEYCNYYSSKGEEKVFEVYREKIQTQPIEEYKIMRNSTFEEWKEYINKKHNTSFEIPTKDYQKRV